MHFFVASSREVYLIFFSKIDFYAQAMRRLDLSALSLIIASTLSIGTVFLYCFIASLTTEQFSCYGDIAYESEWYKFPIKLQKCIHIIIADAQRPHVFYGFKILDLNLWAFTKVCIAVDVVLCS